MTNQLPQDYLLATNPEFRLLTSFSQPARAGKITAVGSGTVTVEMDDQDGGSVTAWVLNGFTYIVDDIVYVLLANNSPDIGIVVGSKREPDNLSIDGELGIGTNSPVDKVEIVFASGERLQLSGPGSNPADAGGISWSEAEGGSPSFEFYLNGSTNRLFLTTQSISNAIVIDRVSGNIAFQQDIPRGSLHIHNGTAGWLNVSKSGVAGTAVTIFPDGAGDVTQLLRYTSVCTNGTISVTGTGSIAPSANATLYSNSGNVVQLIVAANGGVTVRRTSGSGTFTVALRLMWI